MRKFETKITCLAVMLSLLGISLASAADKPAYVDGSIPFVEIKDVDRQAETWAVCAASYDLMSTIMEPKAPDRAKQIADLGNGARVALGMSLVINDLQPDISQEQFNTLWEEPSLAMTELPQNQLYSILADAEKLGTEGAEAFGKKINATVVICINNLRGQQMYIDTWSQLAESGLLQIPQN